MIRCSLCFEEGKLRQNRVKVFRVLSKMGLPTILAVLHCVQCFTHTREQSPHAPCVQESGIRNIQEVLLLILPLPHYTYTPPFGHQISRSLCMVNMLSSAYSHFHVTKLLAHTLATQLPNAISCLQSLGPRMSRSSSMHCTCKLKLTSDHCAMFAIPNSLP